jgi:hypothetical protein
MQKQQIMQSGFYQGYLVVKSSCDSQSRQSTHQHSQEKEPDLGGKIILLNAESGDDFVYILKVIQLLEILVAELRYCGVCVVCLTAWFRYSFLRWCW